MPHPTKEMQEKRKKLIQQGTKDCTTCNKIKPLSDFPAQSGRPGNVASNCKDCRREIGRNHYHRYIDKNRQISRDNYHNNKEAYFARMKRYRKDPKFRKKEREYGRRYNQSEHGQKIRAKYSKSSRRREVSKAWVKRNPEKKQATWAVWKACKEGKLTRPSECSQCGRDDLAIHAHHHKGYAKEHRLDVEWLCVGCHEKAHHNF